MKPNFKSLLILSFFALLFVFSCQNEFLEESSQNQEETLVPNSNLTLAMRSTSANNGSMDDLLDESSCFSVNLPVTIIVNDITVTINTLEDLEIIEELYDEFDDDEDNLEFLFPITIILNDYEEIVIESQDDLEAFIEDCTQNSSDDDIIECVDFVYPITVSIYDANFQVIENVTFNSDDELYYFLDELEDNDNNQVIIASLNFPVTLVYADGSTVEVNSNTELQAAIEAAEDDCYDQEEPCELEDIETNLQECYWEIESYNGDDNYQEVDLMFFEDGTVKVLTENDFHEFGTWNMSVSNNNTPEIVIDGLQEFQMFNGSWIVIECDDDELVIVKEVEGITTTIVLDQDCEDDLDCTAQEMIQELKECKWWMGTNLLSPNYSGPLFFEEDNVLLVGYPDNNQLEGTWEVTLTDSGIFMFLTIGGDYEVIALDWKLFECDEDRFKFVSGDNYLVLEQECWEEGPIGCLEASAIVKCDENNDGFEVFNLYEGLDEIENCEVNNTVSVSFHTSLLDAQSNVNPISSATSYTNISNPQTIYVRVEVLNNPSHYEILEINLILEDCSANCSEEEVNSYLMDCKWEVANLNGSDDLAYFNLYFSENDDLSALNPNDGNTYSGFWNVTETDNGGVLLELANISGPNIQAISGYWDLVECEPDRLQFTNDNNEVLVLERQECYTEEQLYNAISECSWEVQSFIVNLDTDLTSDYDGYFFTFFENDFAYVENGTSIGYGEIVSESTGNSELIVLLNFFSVVANISNYYFVESISDTEIVFIGAGTETELVLARNCDHNNQDGDTEQIKDWLYQGNWEITYSTEDNQDNTADYDGIIFDFENDATLLGDNGSWIAEIGYEVLRDVNGDLRFVINYLGQFPYWQMDDDWFITEVNNQRIELHHVDDDNNNEFVLVFEKVL